MPQVFTDCRGGSLICCLDGQHMVGKLMWVRERGQHHMLSCSTVGIGAHPMLRSFSAIHAWVVW